MTNAISTDHTRCLPITLAKRTAMSKPRRLYCKDYGTGGLLDFRIGPKGESHLSVSNILARLTKSDRRKLRKVLYREGYRFDASMPAMGCWQPDAHPGDYVVVR